MCYKKELFNSALVVVVFKGTLKPPTSVRIHSLCGVQGSPNKTVFLGSEQKDTVNGAVVTSSKDDHK